MRNVTGANGTRALGRAGALSGETACGRRRFPARRSADYRGLWAATAAIAAAALLAATALSAANILQNPGFEAGGDKTAVGWRTDVRSGSYEFLIDGDAHSGRRAIGIRGREQPEQGWARWYTSDLYVIAGARYRAWAWMKGPGHAEMWIPSDDGGLFRSVEGTTQWQRVEGEFSVGRTGRHGMYLQIKGAGSVSFDDVGVAMIEAAPAREGESVLTDGEPIAGIVVPDAAGPHHGYLAMEAQRVFEAMTGRAPPVASASSLEAGDDARRLWIGHAPERNNYASHLERVGEEGIVVDIGPEAIVCLGNTARGVYYAVHELFHLLGCRWCWPGALGEVIPKVERLSLPPRLIVHRPSFDLRGGHIIQVYHKPPDWEPVHVTTENWVDWAARNRVNRLKASYPRMWDYGAIRGGAWEEFAGHTLYTILPPEKWFDEHPEYYPLVDGERTHTHSSGRHAEICVSNDELPQVVADYICEYFASHPDAKRFGINAEDEPSYWCECEECKALDTEKIDWSKNGIETMHLTDRWMYFINRVARIVEREYPDKTIFTFAYGSTRELPHKHLPRHNVMIELTWWDRCFKHTVADANCEVNAKGMERFRNWSRLAGLSLYRYLDYHHLESPCPYYHAEADMLRTVHGAGCRHLSDEWDTTFTSSPLMLNLRARLAWDINTDVDAYIDDFCRRVYGSAGPAIARYFRRLERAVREAPVEHVRFNETAKFTPQVLSEAHALLDEAEAAAEDGDVIARIDRLRYSLLFAELDKVSEAAKGDPKLYERQSQIQNALWQIVKRNDIAPVLGYFGKLGRAYRPPVDAITGERVMQLPEQWWFKTDPEELGEKERWYASEPDDTWQRISIHQPWEEQGFGGYDGDAWYTIEVAIPRTDHERVWLLCEAVDETFKLWINGEYAGASEGEPGLLWDKPVAVEITGKYEPGQSNRITMKVHDIGYAGGIWKPVWITASD